MKSENVKYDILMGVLHAVAFLPLTLLYVFSDAISFVIHRVVGYRREVVRKNLRNSFPKKDKKELRRIERKFYQHFCDTIIETVKLLHISDRQLRRRVMVSNEQAVYEALEGNHPVILYLGHFGNWEWVPALQLHLDKPEIMGALYKPLHNQVMDRVMIRIRSRLNITHLPHNSAYRRLLELREQSASFMIGFIADQRPLGGNLRHTTTFMGQPTAYMAGGETIGSRVQAHYVYVECEKIKRGYYRLNFKKMEPKEGFEGDYPFTHQFYQMLEQSIRNQPAYWLWSHNRWKVKTLLI